MNDSIKYWDENIVVAHIGTEIKWLFEYLESNNIHSVSFIDIGANVGKFYDEISKTFKVENCLLVEASRDLCDYMEIKFQNEENVKIFNYGISNQEGFFKFDDSGIDYWTNRELDESINLGLSKMNNSSGDTYFYRIENFLEKHLFFPPHDITFIKIDTENRDLQILEDLKFYLSKNGIKPFILFENNYHNDMTTYDAQKIIDDFCNLCGYQTLDISLGAGDKQLKPIL